MKVHLRQIPPEGLHLSGEADCPITEFESEDVRCRGSLRYNLDLGVSEDSLWANGTVSQPVELRCVACLEPFESTINIPAFTLHTELNGPETVDLSPFFREDVLLNLPAHPHCDREGGRVCPGRAVLDRGTGSCTEEEGRVAADWSALDELQLGEQ